VASSWHTPRKLTRLRAESGTTNVLKDGEQKSYAGVLFVREDALRALAPTTAVGGLVGADLVGGERLEIAWRRGGRSQISWRELAAHADLGYLPAPQLAFVDRGEIGLLFASETPHAGLQFREPHSIVHCIGVVSANDLHDVPVTSEAPSRETDRSAAFRAPALRRERFA
jgi:hypothetical protein